MKPEYAAIFLALMLTSFIINWPEAWTGSASIKEGMFWKIKMSGSEEVYGWGGYRGTFRSTVDGLLKYEVEDITDDRVTLTIYDSVEWSYDASGFFEKLLKNARGSGSKVQRYDLILDRFTSKILASSPGYEFMVGGISNELINPEEIEVGIQISRSRVDLDNMCVENKFNVSETVLSIKGFDINAWHLHYFGMPAGRWMESLLPLKKAGITPSNGSIEHHLYYDKDFGILIGFELKGRCEYQKGRNSVEQNIKKTSRLIESNIWYVNTFDVDPKVTGLRIDGKEIPSKDLPKAFLYSVSSVHIATAPKEVLMGEVKYIFQKWSSGAEVNELIVTSTKTGDFKAIYSTQYWLTVKSKHGSPKGEGWYDSGATATFSVESTLPFEGILGQLGVRYVFERWSGDSNAATIEATIIMDSPKTVEAIWRIDYAPLYILILTLIILIAILYAIYKLKRRLDQVIVRLQERYHINV